MLTGTGSRGTDRGSGAAGLDGGAVAVAIPRRWTGPPLPRLRRSDRWGRDLEPRAQRGVEKRGWVVVQKDWESARLAGRGTAMPPPPPPRDAGTGRRAIPSLSTSQAHRERGGTRCLQLQALSFPVDRRDLRGETLYIAGVTKGLVHLARADAATTGGQEVLAGNILCGKHHRREIGWRRRGDGAERVGAIGLARKGRPHLGKTKEAHNTHLRAGSGRLALRPALAS